MEKIKQFLSDKRWGFFVTLGVAIISIVAGFVYIGEYSNSLTFMSWPAVIVAFVGAALSILLICIKQAKWAPFPMALANLVLLLLFIEHIYGYIAVVAVAIDLDGVDGHFLNTVIWIGLAFVAGIANCFMPQVKEEEGK